MAMWTKFPVFAALCLIVLMASSGAARADEAERQKLFIELYGVMRYDRILQQMTDGVGAQVEAALRQKYPQIEQDALTAMREVMSETFAELGPEIARFSGNFMVQNFTEDDIRNMISFYRTPTGQKALTLLPKMTQEMTGWLVPMMKALQGRLLERLNERLQPKGYTL
jgi:hypothetical protein